MYATKYQTHLVAIHFFYLCVALTSDRWTFRGKDSYITITACYVCKNVDLINYVLQTGSMSENHIAEIVASVLKAAITVWMLPCQHVPPIVYDNAERHDMLIRYVELQFAVRLFLETNILAPPQIKLSKTCKLWWSCKGRF